MQPKVSMVMPCYNKADYIGKMFDSIVAQKWCNIELILVNDGSTDTTRDVICVYEPKFLERGFEVLIIDQENRGVAAAVYEGLKRATGEYICQIDADDELDPEYVSAMACHLERNSDCDWAVCDSDKAPFHHSLMGVGKPAGGTYPYPPAESFLLRRIAPSACLKMFRKSYMKSCRVLWNFAVEPRATQEPQIFLPLALGGSKPFYIQRPLYRCVERKKSIMTSLTGYEKHLRFKKEYSDLTAKALTGRTQNKLLLESLLSAHSLIASHYHLSSFVEYDDPVQAAKLADIINLSGCMESKIEAGVAKQSGFEPLERFFSNKIIGYKPPETEIKRKPGGRIIAYAAFGKAAKYVRHGLLRSNIRPDVFWDIAAKPGDAIDGIPVTGPCFESLSHADICLVLLKDVSIIKNVLDEFADKLPRENVRLYYEIVDCLAECFYGSLNLSRREPNYAAKSQHRNVMLQ
jgi:glycosyltransferase involved in cell wall biosynthesis